MSFSVLLGVVQQATGALRHSGGARTCCHALTVAWTPGSPTHSCILWLTEKVVLAWGLVASPRRALLVGHCSSLLSGPVLALCRCGLGAGIHL